MNKQDILKTILIIWLFAATGYVLYDLYNGYKVRGIQAAYQQGFSDSVGQVIQQAKKNGCTPFEVHSGDLKADLVDSQCLPQTAILQNNLPAQQIPAAKR